MISFLYPWSLFLKIVLLLKYFLFSVENDVSRVKEMTENVVNTYAVKYSTYMFINMAYISISLPQSPPWLCHWNRKNRIGDEHVKFNLTPDT